MAAGDSADLESQRQLALAVEHEQAAIRARSTASNYAIAARTEKETARILAPLAAIGYVLLPDRRWPGSRRAQVDLVVVGPGGVFIVDTKAWSEMSIAAGRIYRGNDDVTDEIGTLAGLAHQTQSDLAEIGLAPGEVQTVLVMSGRSGLSAMVEDVHVVGARDVLRHISSRGQRLTPGQVDTVLARVIEFFPQVDAPAPVVAAVPEPVIPAPPIAVQEGLLTEAEVSDALLEAVMAEPIEQWMSFLHPQQAKLVRRSFAGPSRVRGPAGTGKTVVALHRAAHLARTRAGNVLVTTYVKSLPAVLRQLLGKLAPEVADRVEFSGIHSFATRLLKDRGIEFRLDPQSSRDAFRVAWVGVGARSPLASSARSDHYWSEEIDYVLKGRGITRFDQYAELSRTGRRHRLPVEARRDVWRLYEAYQAELSKRGVVDYADLILLAEQELKARPLDGYSAVIIDEAQDLSCAMVRMMYSIVGDAPDGLTLVGDGQQSIYPGGYTLAEAGISLAGRGVVLDVNYRNTAQIVSFAQRLVDGDEYSDIEGVLSTGDTPSSVSRTGPEPVTVRPRNARELAVATQQRIHEVTSEVGTELGDVAVLCVTRRGVRAAEAALRAAGIPVLPLDRYDGTSTNEVKVGTIKRAKGLEFKQVLLPDIWNSHLNSRAPDADAEQERWELTRRELYVAMTRARDGLWVAIS